MIKEKVNTTNIDFQILFESAPNLYLVLSPDLKIISASNAYLKATFTKRNEIIGRRLFDVFPDNPDNPDANGMSNLHASLKMVMKTKEPHTMDIQKYDIRRPDGVFEDKFWRPLNVPVMDDQNDVAYIIHRVDDVTDLEKAKRDLTAQLRRKEELEAVEKIYIQNLKASESRFLKIFNLSPIVIFITSVTDGRLLLVNRAFEKLFLFKREDVIGKTLTELKITEEENKLSVAKNIKEKGRQVLETEIDLRDAFGDVKNMLASTVMIEIDNKECFLKAMVDITQRKKQQDAFLQLNKELEAFSYSVSHDLRAPLRAVTGYAKMLEEDYANILDSEGKRLLGTISSNAERMGHLIDNLLSFSRLGRKDVTVKDTDMNALVENAITELNKTTTSNAKIIIQDLHRVKSDHALMSHVLINLIDNAVKYSSKSKNPVIEIKSEQVGKEIVYSIKDNGAGFDMRYVNKLFGVFQRLHTEDEFEGTGVGLAIVQRIINKHGGRVWAESKVNQGATFFFSLPAR